MVPSSMRWLPSILTALMAVPSVAGAVRGARVRDVARCASAGLMINGIRASAAIHGA